MSSLHVSMSWWRHQMETFSALLAICAGNSPVPGEFPTQRPVTRSFDVFFDLHLNKRLSKQSWGWWFETPTRSLWRQCNVCDIKYTKQHVVWAVKRKVCWQGSSEKIYWSCCGTPLKTDSYNNANFVVTNDTRHCRYNNLRCRQCSKFVIMDILSFQ